MPNVLPTALPWDSAQTTEPWLSANALGSAIPAGINESFHSLDLPTALGFSDTAEGNDFTGLAGLAESPGRLPSALEDDALSRQLAGPAAALSTALPACRPESLASEMDASGPGESIGAAVETLFDAASSSAAGDKDAIGPMSGITDIRGAGTPGADYASGGQGSSTSRGATSLSLSIRDMSGILNKVAQAGLPICQAAAREETATVLAAVATAVAQTKDLNSRFEEQQMNELMKSSQMRAIYG